MTLALSVERGRVNVLYASFVCYPVEHVLKRALHLLINARYRALVLWFCVGILLASSRAHCNLLV